MHFRTSYTEKPHTGKSDLGNLRRIFPYIWDYRGRVLIALLSLILSKLAVVAVPLLLRDIVDSLDISQQQAGTTGQVDLALVLPLSLLLGYGALRLASSLFNEVRDAVFARVRYHGMRKLSLQVLRHLHDLSLRFHLERKTGNIINDLERGTNSISSILNYLVFNILPTLAEFILVAAILTSAYEPRFAIAVFTTVFLYIGFTLWVTEWRMHYRHAMNRFDSEANGQAVDGLLNYETVKYFNNEALELQRYDNTLTHWEDAAVKSQTSMSLLNFGQGAIIAIGVTAIMIFAGQGVVAGTMTLGDLVLVNALMLQLFMPLSFLGIIYRMLKYTLADMAQVFKLLDQKPEIADQAGAKALQVSAGTVRFNAVSFSYQKEREVLRDISFEVPAGHKIAVVGASGAGKSTLARLLFRFYDVSAGHIEIDGQDIATVTQQSLRQAIGIVPQDTVLFNDSILYNILYAQPNASRDDVENAAKLANIHDFIASLPDGYDTIVGERGLKLSGGEKQRVAIARVILKNPRILVFDEATSSLDSHSEQAILSALRDVAADHTTLAIAHRLSTIVDADSILVLDGGRLVEQGTHSELLAAEGFYSRLWQLQQEERERQSEPAVPKVQPA